MAELSAFVILPSRPEFIDLYTDVLVPVLESAGYTVERAEDIFEHQNALKDAVLNIHRASIVVADLTIPNANVLYELGIAQGLFKPTILLTQRIERMPFDLRSYRVLQYSLHYKRVEEFKQRLLELAESYKTNLLDYANPVVDLIPELIRGTEAERLAPNEDRFSADALPQAAATEVNMGDEPYNPVSEAEQTQEIRRGTAVEETEERPKILDFALTAVQAMDTINDGVRRMIEGSSEFAQQLSNHNANIKAIRARGVSGDPRELREALNSTAEDMTGFMAAIEAETLNLKDSWEQLLMSTTDLIAAVSIESSEDREAANLFAGQMKALQFTVNSGVGELAKLKEIIARTPNISKTLNRAIIGAEQAVNTSTRELITGQSYVQRTLHLVQERLNAHGSDEQPSTDL